MDGSETITLKGGPADGKEIDRPNQPRVLLPDTRTLGSNGDHVRHVYEQSGGVWLYERTINQRCYALSPPSEMSGMSQSEQLKNTLRISGEVELEDLEYPTPSFLS